MHCKLKFYNEPETPEEGPDFGEPDIDPGDGKGD